jgi:precorrin-6Y C5,15-methyltransferase (decarboxylating)
MKFDVIGLTDAPVPSLTKEVRDIIARSRVFSGGRRHHALVAPLLPAEAQWIDIAAPLDDVFARYGAHESIVVFASGDPLFYGFAATLLRVFPDSRLTVYPAFNSLQMLAHRLNKPYQDMRAVSLTGRGWDGLDEALIRGERLIGCLTDRTKTPEAIWKRMVDYGYTNYRLYVGEHMGNDDGERVREYGEGMAVEQPNCVLMEQISPRHRPFGLPEGDFALLNGREKMITKMPVRLCTLAALSLNDVKTFWDIGSCTGSVSIEARLQFPHLHVRAFERRSEGDVLMTQNARRFGAPGIEMVACDFMEADLSAFERPDAVFIGGHGGRLKAMLKRIKEVLKPGGCVVFNSVSGQSRQLFEEAAAEADMTCNPVHTIKVDNHNPITIMKAI